MNYYSQKARVEADGRVPLNQAQEGSAGVQQMGKGMDRLLSKENSITHWEGQS